MGGKVVQRGTCPGGQLPPGQVPPGQVPLWTSSTSDKFPPDKFPFGQLSPGQVPLPGKHLKRTSSPRTTSPRTSSPTDNFPPGRHIPQPCARRAHRNPPTNIHSPNVGSLYPIPIYLYYKMSVEFINWYWIYSANIWGIYVIWRVSVRPSGAGLGNISGQECTFSYMYTCIGYKLPTFGEYMQYQL